MARLLINYGKWHYEPRNKTKFYIGTMNPEMNPGDKIGTMNSEMELVLFFIIGTMIPEMGGTV